MTDTQIIGRIYKITSSECDGVYIGSTTQQLTKRWSDHKNQYKLHSQGKFNYVTSFEVCKYTDAKIELVHEGLFNNRKDMETFEGDVIRTTPNAVNKVVVGRSQQQYYEENKDITHARWKTKYDCPLCGGRYTNNGKLQHFRTNKHIKAASSSESSSVASSLESETDTP